MGVGSFGILGKNVTEDNKSLKRDLRKTIKIGDITLSQVSDILCSRHYTSNPDTCHKECILGRNKVCDRSCLRLDELDLQKNKRVNNPFYNKGE